MEIRPTLDCRGVLNRNAPPKPHLSIEMVRPDAEFPFHSWFRGQNVGVGGNFGRCVIAQGQPIRRATQAELRIIDRVRIAEMLAKYPDCILRVRRSWHS